MYDWVIADCATCASDGCCSAPSWPTDPVVVRKRSESAALLAALLGQHGQQALGLPDDERLKATSQFVVGGVGQALTAWLTGQVALTQDELIDQLAWFIDRLSRRLG